MGFKKCPKCELNYIRDDQKYCDVCNRKAKGSADEEQEDLLCIECGEHPAMRGKEICTYCYKESLRQEQLSKQRKSPVVIGIDEVEIDDVEVPLADDDIPETEIHEIETEFGDDDIDDDIEEEEIESPEDELEDGYANDIDDSEI